MSIVTRWIIGDIKILLYCNPTGVGRKVAYAIPMPGVVDLSLNICKIYPLMNKDYFSYHFGPVLLGVLLKFCDEF